MRDFIRVRTHDCRGVESVTINVRHIQYIHFKEDTGQYRIFLHGRVHPLLVASEHADPLRELLQAGLRRDK